MQKMVHRAEIEEAYNTIRKDIFHTPLEYSPKLSEISGANVYLKMEHLQYSGSFKIRGVLNKIISLNRSDFSKTFVAASTGNHAAAFAMASKKFGFKGVLFMPKKASETKVEALISYDLEMIFYGENSVETEARAIEYSKEVNGVLIHPYNDPEIIKGQGTIGIEVENQLPEVDVIVAPVGGGGLVSGICSYFAKNMSIKVIGCQPENASEMYDSVIKGEIVSPSIYSTIADATAGGIEENAVTFDICKKHLDGFELISEENIKKAIAFLVKNHQTIVEPGGALPVAALLNSRNYKDKNVVLVLSGKKISTDLLTEILNNYGNNY